MSSLYILLPVALVFFIAICALFFWAVNHRQFDDLDREAQRILYDDERRKKRADKNDD
ncbi:MAG: cbb3-type cytochrome oxidase assembly protein CcoS [Spongiibacter sp.]|uniref:cbb3-type cytochrome oxidase assembly protein CcoS n=1 Tax=Spongiibacter sp. TaxID=2024860 RepID=UPI000C0B55B5|nr:cbb3-type cytochrome oxidase assembly protein CcoS [Spongiibacter sp.]MAK43985.1 cbb3-type cytochrome oxidase assembly protein CcoS [Spongiibacter sp.]